MAAYARQRVKHEGALRSAFQNLLTEVGKSIGWALIPELPGASIRPDGTFRDAYYLERGYWEAKDTQDKLEAEIQKKIAKGYPLTNTIFEDTRKAYLYQNGEVALEADLTQPQQLITLLVAFFSYTVPAHEDFTKAVEDFKQRVPDLARGLVEKLTDAHKNNTRFIKAFDGFHTLCRTALNPNLSMAAVDEMLVQHLLTERLIRTIFDNQDFTQRNAIAREVEKVIAALVSKSFNRHDFLKSLDPFYLAIESAARTITDFGEKQHFLNTVYERFFQGYSVQVADTHGIVYTPQPIVDFMCASVAEVLQTEFGKGLGGKDVTILDPCTGTGNFIVNLLRRVPKRDLPRLPFADDFHAFAEAGKKLAQLHLDYEKLEPYPLRWIETPGMPLSYRVEKMRLNKDKTSLQVNDSLTLAGIPAETSLYRLGNRSALEWIIDQYQVSEDKRSGIRSDPNRRDDAEYIVRLIGQVVRVSVETVKIVQGLPGKWAESSETMKGKTAS